MAVLAAGARAPDFILRDLHGAETSLASLLAGGQLLLVFFKISCPTCQFSLPFLDRIADGGRLNILGISQDEPRSTESFRSSFGVKFPTLTDEPRTYPASNAYGISSVPSLFLIGDNGLITWSGDGFSRRDFAELGRRAGVNPFREGERIPEYKPG
ncbi:MAG TPA: TlpA disulfide reductase family protein [Bryobacteraceae bacterium]|nr:TlpA disulfide reductase family protein [Bryobacteraceae bacterium]